MGHETLTDYERKRLENIKRNQEVLASLNVHHKLNELSSVVKRCRSDVKSFKRRQDKKSKAGSPVVIRRSLRSLGIAPDSTTLTGLDDDLSPANKFLERSPKPEEVDKSGPLTMNEAHSRGSDNHQLVGIILDMQENAPLVCPQKFQLDDAANSCVPDSLVLKEENIARLVPSRVMNVKFFPSLWRTIIVVGDKFGNVGFWDANCKAEGEGVYLYSPHSAPVSGISVQPFSLSKMITSSYDGLIRLMDVEEEKFNVIYSTEEAVYSLSQQADANLLYFAEGPGDFKIWDMRAGKASCSCSLHAQRINSIDFLPSNTNLVATSSTDGSACIWDLRAEGNGSLKHLKVVHHKRPVHSAYFSPSGSYLATTSLDNTVGLLSGTDFTDTVMIGHYNHVSRWISTFRAIWGWDDTYLFIGNVKRGLDVITVGDGKIRTVESSHMKAIPCRFAIHPCRVGTLAGTTGGGQVYMWTLD